MREIDQIKLSIAQRDMLIAHIDGSKVPIVNAVDVSGIEAREASGRRSVRERLIRFGFLSTAHQIKPQYTVITEAGRAALAELLGDYADALQRAGYGVMEHDRGIPGGPRIARRRPVSGLSDFRAAIQAPANEA